MVNMTHSYDTRSKTVKEPYGLRLDVKELLKSAKKEADLKRKKFHAKMHTDPLTPPDSVKSSNPGKALSDLSKNLFRTPPPGYNSKPL